MKASSRIILAGFIPENVRHIARTFSKVWQNYFVIELQIK